MGLETAPPQEGVGIADFAGFVMADEGRVDDVLQVMDREAASAQPQRRLEVPESPWSLLEMRLDKERGPGVTRVTRPDRLYEPPHELLTMSSEEFPFHAGIEGRENLVIPSHQPRVHEGRPGLEIPQGHTLAVLHAAHTLSHLQVQVP